MIKVLVLSLMIHMRLRLNKSPLLLLLVVVVKHKKPRRIPRVNLLSSPSSHQFHLLLVNTFSGRTRTLIAETSNSHLFPLTLSSVLVVLQVVPTPSWPVLLPVPSPRFLVLASDLSFLLPLLVLLLKLSPAGDLSCKLRDW